MRLLYGIEVFKNPKQQRAFESRLEALMDGQPILVEEVVMSGCTVAETDATDKVKLIQRGLGRSLGQGMVLMPLLGLDEQLGLDNAGSTNLDNLRVDTRNGKLTVSKYSALEGPPDPDVFERLVDALKDMAKHGDESNFVELLKKPPFSGAATAVFGWAEDDPIDRVTRQQLGADMLRGLVEGIRYFERNVESFCKAAPDTDEDLKRIARAFGTLTSAERFRLITLSLIGSAPATNSNGDADTDTQSDDHVSSHDDSHGDDADNVKAFKAIQANRSSHGIDGRDSSRVTTSTTSATHERICAADDPHFLQQVERKWEDA